MRREGGRRVVLISYTDLFFTIRFTGEVFFNLSNGSSNYSA